MLRTVATLLALLSLTSSPRFESVPIPLRSQADVLVATHTKNRLLLPLGTNSSCLLTHPAQSCCKVCSVGKACGNTCISRDKNCHVGPGCACDG
jgi:hypothetical protein